MVDYNSIIISLVTTIVMIPLSGLLLMLSAKIFKLKDQSYKTAIKIAAILGVVGLVLSVLSSFMGLSWALAMSVISFVLVSILLAMWLIKTNYKLEWGKAALVWIVWLVFELIAAVVIGMILAAVFVAIGLSAAAGALAGLA